MWTDPRTETAAAAVAPAVNELVGQDVLDRAVLAGLLELGDPEFFAELVDDFVSSTDPYLETLRCAIADGDAEAVHRTAHTMKSSAANMGATRFSEMCRDIETTGRRGDLTGVGDAFAELAAHYEDVSDALRAEVSSMTA